MLFASNNISVNYVCREANILRNILAFDHLSFKAMQATSHMTYTELRHRSQQVFKVLSISLDTGLQSFSPLVYSPVNDAVIEVSPYLRQSLLQLCQIAYRLLVNALLHTTPDFIVDGL